jgi:hypothetical protein
MLERSETSLNVQPFSEASSRIRSLIRPIVSLTETTIVVLNNFIYSIIYSNNSDRFSCLENIKAIARLALALTNAQLLPSKIPLSRGEFMITGMQPQSNAGIWAANNPLSTALKPWSGGEL